MNCIARVLAAAGVAVGSCVAFAEAYEIGEEMVSESFWKSDPVLFVRRHADSGFEFTSEQREGADSRQDGGVTCFGLPVYESRISFGQAGGIERVELMLYARAGTETYKVIVGPDGSKFRRRMRLDKSMTRDEFAAALDTVRGHLTAAGKNQPAIAKENAGTEGGKQRSQTWPRTALPTEATLTWNYDQHGKSTATFKPGFIRLAVNGPARLATTAASGRGVKRKMAAKGAKKITDNVINESKGRGDVFIDNVPMVDQGQKGYCSVATAERVLRYYGVEIDEHQIAEAAGTSADEGTDVRAMKRSVEAIGKRFRLGTMVCYGGIDKGTEEKISALTDEVRLYNKAARKMKKPEIADSVYITQHGNTMSYSPMSAYQAMDPEVMKEMKVNGPQKSKFTKFKKDIHDQVLKGIPLFWGVTLGIYPEPGLLQEGGGHMRLIIGYNDKKNEILYTDSWGAGHELKRMPVDWAWTITHSLMYMKPLSK